LTAKALGAAASKRTQTESAEARRKIRMRHPL
jgi:hypothetical protein